MTPLRSSLLAVALLLSACGSPFSDAPPVADSTFASVLAELHLAEARLRLSDTTVASRRASSSDTMRAPVPTVVRDSILTRHGLTERGFRRAFDYYVERPDRYKDVYAQVVDTLTAEREALRFEGERFDTPPRDQPARPTPDAFRRGNAGRTLRQQD